MQRTSPPGFGTVGLTLLAPISWGTTYVTVTELLPPGRPLLVAASRVAPAGLLLVVLARRRGGVRPRGTAWRTTLMLGACNFGVFFPLLIVAVNRLPGGVAAAMGGIQPLLVAGLTAATTGERARPAHLAGGAVAAVGVAMVVLRPRGDIDTIGLIAALAANLSFSAGVVLTRRHGPALDPIGAAGWQMLTAAAVLVPLAFVIEGPPSEIDAAALVGFAHLGLIATAVAFLLWFAGIRVLPATTPPLLGLAAPITGATLGWALLGEDLTPLQLAGFAVTIAAIVHGTRLGRPSVDRPTERHRSHDPTPRPEAASSRPRNTELTPCP